MSNMIASRIVGGNTAERNFCPNCGASMLEDDNGRRCKVGDTVYQSDTAGRVYEAKIRKIIYDTEAGIAFDEDAIGRSVYLTREEAEAALEGMKNG